MTISISISMTISMTKKETIPNSMTIIAMTRTVIVFLLLLLGGGRGDKQHYGPPRLGRQTPA